MCGIYVIRNLVNGKYYLGSSKNIEKRFQTHKRDLRKNNHHNMYLQNSYNKYGLGVFSFELLVECPSGELFNIEQKYLDNLDYNTCYNIAKGACGGDNLTQNPNREDIIRRMTQTNIDNNKKLSEAELSKKYSKPGDKNGMFGKKHSLESRQKMSDNQKGKPAYNKGLTFEEYHGSEKAKEIKEKISESASKRVGELNHFYGKHHTEETKQKIRDIHTGKKNDVCAIPFTIDGVYYRTLKEAENELGIPGVTIRWRIKSKNPKFDGYQYVTDNIINGEIAV